jgi:carboxypeptidase Taq
MARSQDPFSKLHKRSLRIAKLQSIRALLEWDLETYLPKAAGGFRSDQLELLAEEIHKELTSNSYKKALNNFIDIETGKIQGDYPPHLQKAAKEYRKNYLQEMKLPTSFVKKFTKTTSTALPAWDQAKKTNNFSLFAPHLEKIVLLCKKKADLLGYKEHPYDALLDLYEPDLTVKTLTPLFNELKTALTSLLAQIKQKPLPSPLTGHFPKEAQDKLSSYILEKMGFSKETSRLDLSSHPFCTGIHPLDIRMTTRIDPSCPLSSLYSVLHEGGHGLYHQNLPIEHYGTPLCDAISYGIDESQSRLWETIIGKSRAFCHFIHPTLQQLFPEALSHLSTEELYKKVNRVIPSEIRVESDEVTYSLHIILRFEIEKELIEGTLSVKDIPEVWNEKMQTYLGITPSYASKGCLQDVHWAMGGIGYFPSYTLGNLLAAQLFSTIKKAFPDWDKKVQQGEFSFLSTWLKEKIHCHGKLYTASEVIQQVTGKPLGVKDYITYLTEKHL